LNVYEFNPEPFRLKRHISASAARWEPEMNAWIFEKAGAAT